MAHVERGPDPCVAAQTLWWDDHVEQKQPAILLIQFSRPNGPGNSVLGLCLNPLHTFEYKVFII